MGEFARALELPFDSPEHRYIRDTVIVAGGGFLTARYFLTVLTVTSYDFRDVPEAKYLQALRKFLIESVSPDAPGCVATGDAREAAEREMHATCECISRALRRMDAIARAVGLRRLRRSSAGNSANNKYPQGPSLFSSDLPD